ncbi:hypothetical protein HV824_09155 [Myxococcus sp. AM009]|uniref:hypothetical protein n=1 Tax=Myxococcus TaxID=32 RepID=UPI001594F775|nr:hypothetical protein [Myxococcus sp. AM009]NVI98290.1 hypothetical protein [Myxococcus sp. AM009]
MKNILFFLTVGLSATATAVEYRCTVNRKLSVDYEYTAAELEKLKFHNLIEETAKGTFISRCGFSLIAGQVTCDRYKVDRVEVDPFVKIKKFYIFRSQFNLQVFRNLDFIEDHGRGGISFGKCELTAP